ncbi:SpoIIIAH-like family protein [Virgibacillus dakarensis]|uniref:Stage III sporulation protein AH n=1 Tax=Lentibacillus populi TaxID=1827502 RepID=A0A9W5U1U6_9BACI|nr:SpoIIIAH-like family protein [Lentibacillus populi]MTW85117.1 SpoIIIAH-like family protein [Virgibacillus dakarensis]GGB62097.1 stage III sporulation protein AH [Lentibacillus populi]
MLKKQTVWLLTMLSLMIVLSVYYMTSPDTDELAFLENGKEDKADETATADQPGSDDAKVDETTNIGEDQLFASLRLEIQEQRSKEKSRLEEIVASSTASTSEKNQAYDDIDAIEQRSSKETMVEDTILASADYQDVLVRFDDSDQNKVHVNVKVNEKLPNQEVLNIMQMVRDEFGEIPVTVNWQPVEG